MAALPGCGFGGRRWAAVGLIGLIGCASPVDPSGNNALPAAPDASGIRGDADPFTVPPDADLGGPGAADGGTSSAEGHVELPLPATAPFTDTGLELVRGELVTVIVAGEIAFGTAPGERSSPDGVADLAHAPGNVVAPVRHAAVLGRIGADGAIFRVGSAVALYAPVDGRLYLGVNDADLTDNSGAFTATVDVGPTGSVPTVTPSTGSVSVSATTAWLDGGIDLATFGRVTFATTGTINVAPTVTASATGVTNPDARVYNVLPGTNHGIVMGKIGAGGTPFAVAASLTLSAPYPGRLYLGVNDIDLANNSGAFTTSVAVAAP